VMVTSETAIEKITEALEPGADEYLMKPFTEDALLEKLELARTRY
jgi:DNA-binding response OmpR family regulator